MVGASDLKVYESFDGVNHKLGGSIDESRQILNATPNNLFVNVSRPEQVAGTDEYKCCFFKNGHASENMDNFKLWLSSKRAPNDTEVKWSFDPLNKKTVVFDGGNDYIDCGTPDVLMVAVINKVFILFLDMAYGRLDGNARVVVNHSAGIAQSFVCFIDSATPNRINFEIRNAANTAFVARSTTLELSEFNHVVCVYDNSLGSANLKIYVDTVVGATTANLTEAINLSNILTLAGDTNDYKGYMKEFKFWKSKALSQTEINDVYNGASTAPDPDYYLPMNDFEHLEGPHDEESGGEKIGTFSGADWTGHAQTIAGTTTEPHNMDWQAVGSEPSDLTFRRLYYGMTFPIWIWYHVEPNAESRLDDSELFSFKFTIPQGGTGSGGSGSDPDPVGGGGSGGGGNPPPPSADYKIAVAGDWGCEGETDDVIDRIKANNYDLLVGVGDNAYASADCWISRFNSIKSIFKISAYGNHEYSESGGASPYKTFFGDNKTYYSFKFENIMFFVMDSNIDMDTGSAQHNTIKSALQNSLSDNTITWRIGVIHHPWFGADSDHSYNDGNSVQAFHRLFQDNKVQFVLAGHNHNWQRTHQVVYNSGNPESPTVVDNTSPYSATKKGIIHVISGTGGHDSGSSLYALGGQPSFQAYQNRSNNGIFELVASNNGQTLTGSFVNTDGSKFGTFTMTAT